MNETSIQVTLSEEEISDLEKATGCKIEDKEDLYQAVLTAIQHYTKADKKIKMMGYGRFNQSAEVDNCK